MNDPTALPVQKEYLCLLFHVWSTVNDIEGLLVSIPDVDK